jgi:hypothetical protein
MICRFAAWEIGSRDLLCYVCKSKNSSIIQRNDRDAFDKAVRENPGACGMTAPLDGGVCSEVWLEECGFDIRAVQNTIYHEWMHNKTNYAAGEDPNWVHKTGGGGLAAAHNSPSGEALNKINAQKMCKRLHISNRQFVAGLGTV